jgi:hypothetical protein
LNIKISYVHIEKAPTNITGAIGCGAQI